jgi:hypothetical protein
MQRRVIIIFGQTGSGKTTLAKKIIEHHRRVVIFDSQEEYEGFTVSSFDEFREYFTGDVYREEFTVVCRYRDEIDYQLTADALPFIKNVLLVLEEAELYLTSWDRSNYLFPLISFGRHQRISLLAIGRRPSEIAAKLRSQCTSIFTFIQKEPRDLDFLLAWDFDPEAVKSLPRFEYATVGESFESVTSQGPQD